MVSSIPSEEDIYFLVLVVVVVAASTCDINLLLNGTKKDVKFDSQCFSCIKLGLITELSF
jgi:hypothetical protein